MIPPETLGPSAAFAANIVTDAPASSDWIEWSGGDRPHPPETEVEVRYRDGKTDKGQSAFARWWHTGHPSPNDIIAYRLADTPASAAKGEGEIEFRVTMTRYVMAGDPDDAIERAISEVIGCWDADDFSAVPHPSQQAGTEGALRGLVSAWEVLGGGNYGPSRIQRWLIDDMKPAIDDARAMLAALPAAPITDGVGE